MIAYLKKDWNLLFIFIITYIVFYVIYYPPLSGVEDEIGFINQAIMWSHQKLSLPSPEIEGRYLGDMGKLGQSYIFVRNPFRSATLLPFVLSEQYDLMFYSSLLIHILITVVFAMILNHFKINTLLSVLVLFHPTLSLYSRTIMADSLAALLLLTSFFALIKNYRLSPLFCGIFCGLATLTRYHAAFALIFFSLYYLYPNNSKFDLKNALICFLSGSCFIFIIFTYNYFLYDSIFGLTQSVGTFNLISLKDNFFFYIMALSLIWPGMIISPFTKNSNKYSTLISTIALFYLIFLLFYYFHDSSPNLFNNLVVGQRLLQIALPFWLLSYVLFIHRFIFEFRFQKILFISLSITFVLLTLKIFKTHSNYLTDLKGYKTIVSNTIPENSNILSNKTLIKLFGIPGIDTKNYKWSYHVFTPDLNNIFHQELLDKPFYLAILLKYLDPEKINLMNDFVKKNKLELIKQYRLLYIFKSPHPNQKN